MSSVISAIGLANPEFRFSQDQILEFMCYAHQLTDNECVRLKKLYDLSGIDYRHSVIPDFGLNAGSREFFGNGTSLTPFPSTKARMGLYQTSAKDIAYQSVKNLLADIQDFHISSITHLITVSCTGMYAPGLDIDIQEQFFLSKNIERTCINFMGCYGAFNALKVADYICRADKNAKVLIIAVELCTLHFQRENTLQNWLSNSLFSDGAGAVLIEPEESRSTPIAFKMECFYNQLVNGAKHEMKWDIGDTGFEMYLSSNIAKNIKSKVSEVTKALIDKAGIRFSDISKFAIHPGGRRIIEVCEEALELPGQSLRHSYEVLKQYGNMSSVTILFVLARMLKESNTNERYMSFAFGPGLTFESMILKSV